MEEKDFVICGHGSNNPSTKNMHTYFSLRQSQKMTNGLSKGLLEVRRFLTPEQALLFPQFYLELIGRNAYSQKLRQYVYEAYAKTGQYYSDCSSSICATYEKCGRKIGLLNTDGMHNTGEKVDVSIVDGHIAEEDLSKLQLGDAFLFRGNIERASNGYIGHVEALFAIPACGEWHRLSNGKWMYKKPDGSFAKLSWEQINKHWYYFNDEGIMLTGWQSINGEWYYLEEEGDYEGACWHETAKHNGSLERWNL